MESKQLNSQSRSSIRKRVLAFVGALVILSLLGSTLSLFQITSVNQTLEAINRTTVPLTRVLAKMRSDSDILKRELKRRLGYSRWKDQYWRPQPLPKWIEDVFQSELSRAKKLSQSSGPWASEDAKARLTKWLNRVSNEFEDLKKRSNELYESLAQSDQKKALTLYPKWNANLEQWSRDIRWGVRDSERSIRKSFSNAQSSVENLRTGLQLILGIVVLLSLFLLWLGERALRPLSQLTHLAKEITRRGLKKEDKNELPVVAIDRDDEVSQLALEFRRMATALLEREKTVESQKRRLEENNRLLVEMGHLNQNVIESIQSILIVIGTDGKIRHCNAAAVEWLHSDSETIVGSSWTDWMHASQKELQLNFSDFSDHQKVEAFEIKQKNLTSIFGGYWVKLRAEQELDSSGAILLLEDLTEEKELENRLRLAENLAAVGRLSAQVAHEVRNPLHSIGLEAEMALESLSNQSNRNVKQSIQSILESVDRLDQITENYLKLSRLSSGQKSKMKMGSVLERVLATYAPVCDSLKIKVDWKKEEHLSDEFRGDPALLEQAIGNLFRNSLQALEQVKDPTIFCSLGNTEAGGLWFKIEDNGKGVSEEISNKLFQPFVTSKAQGTGLGLSFVKRVVEEHQGEIEYSESKKLGGASFQIRLPLDLLNQSSVQNESQNSKKENHHENLTR